MIMMMVLVIAVVIIVEKGERHKVEGNNDILRIISTYIG